MPPAGRPRTFDRNEALKKAMAVFWEKGYEGTTMSDIIAAIGTKAPSVYAAFGNKDRLFDEAVNLYGDLVEAGPLKALHETPYIFDAVKNSIDTNVGIFTSSDNPCSCLVMTAAINCSPEHDGHVKRLRDLRASYKRAFQTRFEQAVAAGELIQGADPTVLAEFYMTFVHGLALRAKDGSTKVELQASADYALETLRSMLK